VNLRNIYNGAAFRRRRYECICELLQISPADRVLDVGCGCGLSFEAFNDGNKIVGVDFRRGYSAKNFSFVAADAERLPFLTRSFDVVVSIGCLEHISPIGKLDTCIAEIDRVGRQGAVVVPCITTPLEPHFSQPFWQLRGYANRLRRAGDTLGFEVGGSHERLNYMADDSWLNFGGFRVWKTKRYWHIPGLISNLVIYKRLDGIR